MFVSVYETQSAIVDIHIMIADDDFTELSGISVLQVIQASLNRSRAKTMHNRYMVCKGATPSQIRWLILVENQKDLKDEEIIQKYMQDMTADLFLGMFEGKLYGMQCLSKLMMRYLRSQPVLKDGSRMKLWRTMTRTDKNMNMMPGYYASLIDAFPGSFMEFADIIDLDVRRTQAAYDDPVLRKKLTNILMAYAK